MSLHQEVFVSLFFLSVVYGSNEVSNYEPPCFKYTPGTALKVETIFYQHFETIDIFLQNI